MNEAFNWGITIVAVVGLALGAILAMRLNQRFGFLAPAGFVASVLIHLLCRATMLPTTLSRGSGFDAEKVKKLVEQMPMDDKLFYLSLQGYATGIWMLGGICFLICGILDISASAETVPKSRVRIAWIIVGTLIMAASAFYPQVAMSRLLSS